MKGYARQSNLYKTRYVRSSPMLIAVHASGCDAGAEITGLNLATELNDVNFAVITDHVDVTNANAEHADVDG